MMVVISQPRYLPVISYLQRLAFADVFILLDNVQRQGRGWENRNKLLLPEPRWLTIPISSSSREVICHTQVRDISWVRYHKELIFKFYHKHPHFNVEYLEKYYYGIEKMMLGGNHLFADIIEVTLHNLASLLDFPLNLVRASSLENDRIRQAKGPQKLLEICKAIGAKTYVSGENGRTYGIDKTFANSGIVVKYHPANTFAYFQPGQTAFIPFMAFFDALFCVGKEVLAHEVLRPPTLHD